MGNYAAGSEQVLADKLRVKFASRGAATFMGKSAPTSELMRKIEKTVSPYERVAEPSPREGVSSVGGTKTAATARRAPQIANAGRTATARTVTAVNTQTKATSQARTQSQPQSSAKAQPQAKAQTAYVYDGSYARAYAIGASVRKKADQLRADKAKLDSIAGTVAAVRTPAKKRENAGVVGTVKDKIHSLTRIKEDTKYTAGEKTKSAKFPIEIIVMIALCTLAIMFIIYSISQIYSISSGISDLKKKQGELAKNESALQLELNEREDIRMIERIAVEELGMVKAEAVERNHVSILSGDKIDVVTVENTENGGFFSTMLSAIGTGFSKLFEK